MNESIMKTRVAVIGAGHAGIEAALASARLGCDTALFTMSVDAVANMPCNPSIGGSGKGHLVYELDALGGEMGRAADLCTLQSRTLNESKGSAVRSKRVQADRARYHEIMLDTIGKTPNLRLCQGEIASVEVCGGRVSAVITRLGARWECDAAVIATGTYLSGRVHVGDINYDAGPDGSLPASLLSGSLRSLGVPLMRFKTGTPVRVDASTVDFSRMQRQDGEEHPIPFSYYTPESYMDGVPQSPCHIVYTNADTHDVIRRNLTRSAMYSGNISGRGPRYCPSIEDKLVRFADKERHQLFVEPIGKNSNELYIGGFSTSMPVDVQYEMLHTLDGFGRAHITRHAYAIEYDCISPSALTPTLSVRGIAGLYSAGQSNGTSGYEEAAAQGVVAGANAALYAMGRPPLLIPRSSSYIGIMIDDLVTKGTNEPYRIMTSRSEYRLCMRQDNADERLTGIAYEAGLIPEPRMADFRLKQKQIADEIARLDHTGVSPSESANEYLISKGSAPITAGARLSELLRRPELDYSALSPLDAERPELPPAVVRTVETSVKYEGYIKKQMLEVEKARRRENMILPDAIDYSAIRGLSIEAVEKLSSHRPISVGEASRIPGVTPADVSVLMIYLS